MKPFRQPLPASLYRLILSETRYQQIGLAALSVLTLPLALAPIELQRRIIDDAIALSDVALLLWLGGAYLGVVVVQAGLKYWINMARGRIHERVARFLRLHTLCIPNRGTGPAERLRLSRDVSVVTTEADPIGGFAAQSVSLPLMEGGTLATLAAYMLWTDPALGAVALIAFMPQAILAPWVQARINQRVAGRVGLLRRMASAMSDGVAADRTARSLDTLGLVRRLFNLRLEKYRLKFAMKGALRLIDHIADVTLLVAGGWLVIQGETEIGVVIAFMSGLNRMRAPWKSVLAFYRSLLAARMRYDLIQRIEEGEGESNLVARG